MIFHILSCRVLYIHISFMNMYVTLYFMHILFYFLDYWVCIPTMFVRTSRFKRHWFYLYKKCYPRIIAVFIEFLTFNVSHIILRVNTRTHWTLFQYVGDLCHVDLSFADTQIFNTSIYQQLNNTKTYTKFCNETNNCW